MTDYDRIIKTASIQGITTVHIDHGTGVGVLIFEPSGTRTPMAMSQEMVDDDNARLIAPFTYPRYASPPR